MQREQDAIHPGCIDRRVEALGEGDLRHHVPENIICMHMIVIYVGRNFMVHSYDTMETLTKVNDARIIKYKEIDDLLNNLNKNTIGHILSNL